MPGRLVSRALVSSGERAAPPLPCVLGGSPRAWERALRRAGYSRGAAKLAVARLFGPDRAQLLTDRTLARLAARAFRA